MKKLVIAIVAMTALYVAPAQAQRHIEYRWHGVYVTGDMTYGFNVNRSVDEFDTIACELGALMPGVSMGYQFRKEAGVGVGFNYVADPTGAYTQLPVYAELRSHFLRSRVTPYSVLQVGYCLPLGSSSEPSPVSTKIEEGGLYLAIEAGARYAFNRSIAVAGHAGYRLLMANHVSRDNADGHIFDIPVALHVVAIGATFYFSN